MNVQFTIIDYTTNPLGDATEIDEPVGWDAINFHLKRDEAWHGFFDFVDDSVGSLQFDGASFNILKTAYETYGVEAYIELKVTFQCAEAEPVNTLYQGKFVFSRYKAYCGDRCYIEIGIEAVPSLMHFRNRVDQQVDLDSLSSYDNEPVNQTVTSGATFSAPNTIQFGQLINGLLPGSSITISGTSFNNHTFTVASATPDYNNDIEANRPSTAISQTITAHMTFTSQTNAIFVNRSLTGLAVGSLITITSSAHNDHTFTVNDVVPYFNYTLIYINPSPNALVDETVTCDIAGVYAADSVPSYTTIVVAETVTDEELPTGVTLNATFLKNNLPAYRALNKQIALPGKTIKYNSRWKSPIPTSYSPFYDGELWLSPDWPDILHEIDGTQAGTGLIQHLAGNGDNPPVPDTLVNYATSNLVCQGNGTFEMRVKGKITAVGGYNPHSIIDPQNPAVFGFRVGVVVDSEWAGQPAYHLGDGRMFVNELVPIDPGNNFDHKVTVGNINIREQMQIFIFVYCWAGGTTGASAYAIMNFDAASYFDLKIDSTCVSTPLSGYLVNEAMSRCVESYTDDDMRVYSDYFGRTDAQPYTSTENGCGSLLALTSGLKIRGSIMPNNEPVPRFTASMQELFEGMNAVHNIGMGLEDDPHRAGHKVLRVEPVKYFFNNTVLTSCTGINKAERNVDQNMLTSTFKCGYQQFETWNNNGLYDIFGERSWRTSLNELKRELDRTCKYMASDYAIEFTRRNYGLTTSDSRYDSNTFMLCLKSIYTGQMFFDPKITGIVNARIVLENSNLAPPNPGDTITIQSPLNSGTYTVDHIAPTSIGFVIYLISTQDFVVEHFVIATIQNLTTPFFLAEQGMPSGTSVLHPETVLNYRISPVHNAMRHFKNIAMSYRDYTNAELIFTGGKGNFYAMGQLTDSCKMEGVPLSESANIKRSLFNDADEATPLFRPETVKFEYPLSFNDFLTIYANPYGLIEFQCGSAPAEQGWIEDLQYKPYTGMAEFVLRPRI